MQKNEEKIKNQLHIPLIMRDLWRNAWLIILAGVIGFLSVYSFVGLFHNYEYTSSVTLAVSPKSNGSYVGFYNSLHTANEMAGVFKEVFSSDVLKRLVREDLEKNDLDFTVTAEVEEGTNILRLSVTSSDPIQTHYIMLSVLENYGEVSDYLFGDVVLDTLKGAKVPTFPSNALNMPLCYGVISAVFMIIMTCAIALFSFYRKTIKTVDGAKECMGQAPIGILNHEKIDKKHKNLMINRTSISFRFTEGMLQVAHKIRHRMVKEGKKVLLITSVAENEGKSTLSANLALSMARHGSKVALVDMDLRLPVQHRLFKDRKKCIDWSKAMKEGFVPSNDENLYIFTLSGGMKNPGRFLHSAELKDFFEQLSKTMDIIILDSAPYTAVADVSMLLKYADGCVLCVRQDWAPAQMVCSVAQELEDSQADYIGYVINNYIDNGTLTNGQKHYENYKYYASK